MEIYLWVKGYIEKYGVQRHYTYTGGLGVGSSFLLYIHLVTANYNYTGYSLHYIHIFKK
jgi:hypothetical protein